MSFILYNQTKKARKEINKMGDYFKHIPMQEIQDILKSHGLVAIQEDCTEWAGMFCGYEGNCTIPIVPVDDLTKEPKNLLVISWYHMSNRIEVIKYIS